MDFQVSSYPKRIDGIYKCQHKPYVHVLTRKVLCSDCPKRLRPSDLTIGQIKRILPYRSVFALEVDGDRNQFSVVVL